MTVADLAAASGIAEAFERDGYVVVPGVLGRDEVEALHEEAAHIFRGERGEARGLAAASPEDSDEAVARRYLCMQFPHKLSPLIYDALSHPGLTAALREIIGPNVKSMQSTLFMKPPGKTGQAWHQDEAYIWTRDRSLVAAWIALDDATLETGCLRVFPGSHRRGVIWPRRPHGDPRYDEGWEAYDYPFAESDAVALEIAAGAAVFFHGYILHSSLPNRSRSRLRRALVNHYMSAESPLVWDWDGRLALTDDNRDIVMVCGTDPYAYKGTEDLTFPHVRGETETDRHPDDTGTRTRF